MKIPNHSRSGPSQNDTRIKCSFTTSYRNSPSSRLSRAAPNHPAQPITTHGRPLREPRASTLLRPQIIKRPFGVPSAHRPWNFVAMGRALALGAINRWAPSWVPTEEGGNKLLYLLARSLARSIATN